MAKNCSKKAFIFTKKKNSSHRDFQIWTPFPLLQSSYKGSQKVSRTILFSISLLNRLNAHTLTHRLTHWPTWMRTHSHIGFTHYPPSCSSLLCALMNSLSIKSFIGLVISISDGWPDSGHSEYSESATESIGDYCSSPKNSGIPWCNRK